MEVDQVIAEADDGRYDRRDVETIEGVMIHRCGVDLQMGVVLGYDALSVAAAFTGKAPQWEAVSKATGGQNAYSIMIGGDLGPAAFDGKVWQLLPLDEVGYHGRRFSSSYIGIGLIADPRYQAPSAAQRDSLIELLSAICPAYGWDPFKNIRGHGEVDGAHDGSKAPGKPAACPGDMLPMNLVRADVADRVGSYSRLKLQDAGLILSR